MEVHLELMGIKDLPKLDQPRGKAKHYGISSLSDIELLTLLIGSGYKEVTALEIATGLLTKFKGLKKISDASIEELEEIKGIKEAKAISLLAIFEFHKRLSFKENEENEVEVNEDYLYNKYKDILLSSHQENLVIIILNKFHKIIHEKTLYVGTENNVAFSYKDIWRELLTHKGKSYYLIHNHPGGKCTPSKEDIIFTSELFLESKRIKIPLIDHLIIGDNGYYSFQKLKKE